MRVVYDDIVYSLQKAGGISAMWSNITDVKGFDCLHIRYDDAKNNVFCPSIYKGSLDIRSSKGLVFKRYMNPKIEHVVEPFIFHSSYYRTCSNHNAINITNVYDFVYEYYRKDMKSKLHVIQKKKAIMNSDAVICISRSTKNDMGKFIPEYKGPIKVVYCGYDNEIYYCEKNTVKERVILSVGARGSYKRFDLTTRILQALPDCKLIIIGGGEITKDEQSMLEERLPGRYEKAGYLSNDKIRQLYNKAFFLSYCSDYEGFGIPPIEAQACGCPVICQCRSSIPEVVNNSAIFVDAENIDGSIDAIRKLYDKEFYSRIVSSGLENVRRFSWKKCQEEIASFYEEILEQRNIAAR